MITDKNGRELQEDDVIIVTYRNGYFVGVLERPDYFEGTQLLIRIIAGDDYFYDTNLNGVFYKQITSALSGYDVGIVENKKDISDGNVDHPKRIERYNQLAKINHPEYARLGYDRVMVVK